MTTPTIFADGYNAASINSAPVLRDGSAQALRTTSTIPATTAVDTNVGILPFQKGAKVTMGASTVLVGDGDTGTAATGAVGWVYIDDATYTDDPNGFAVAGSEPQTGGVIPLDAAAGYSFTAEAAGWIVYVPAGETVEVEYTAIADLVVSYN